jgi:hypothetical protein
MSLSSAFLFYDVKKARGSLKDWGNITCFRYVEESIREGLQGRPRTNRSIRVLQWLFVMRTTRYIVT